MDPNKYIRVSYELTAIEGSERESIETATRENPYMFVSGLGVSLDAFEAHIIPLNQGDTFDFTLNVRRAMASTTPTSYKRFHAASSR